LRLNINRSGLEALNQIISKRVYQPRLPDPSEHKLLTGAAGGDPHQGGPQRAKLIGANKLSEAKLDAAQLIRTDLRHAELTGSSIYGISAWDVKVDSGTQQRNLIITAKDEPASFGELRAGGGVDGVWGGKGFESSESGELNDDLFWLGQNRDGVRLEAGAEGLAGFELALEDEGWEGEFLFWEAKEDSGWPAPGTCRGFLGQAGGALELAAGKHYRCDTANAEAL
jgi:hypothetical protein